MRLNVQVLGTFQVTSDARTVAAHEWRRSRSADLVKLLALSRGHRLHREQAMDALWPEKSPEASSANLRKAVHFARQTMGSHEAIAFDHEIVALPPGADLEVDADTFEKAAIEALRDNDASRFQAVADLYPGELLPDDRYVTWADAPRERMRQLYVRVLKAGKLFDRLLEVDPTDEEAQRALMQDALDSGNRGEVIRRFQQLRERLRVDLGVGPARETVALYERALDEGPRAPASVTDRVRGSLAWGIVHLHSGDLARAEEIARDARLLAIEAGLAREVGEASALLGMVAHMQGQWPRLFRSEFVAWIDQAPAMVSNIFDGHLCLAEFCLCGADGHERIGDATRELLAAAERTNSIPGRALAMLILGEIQLFGGQLDAARELLLQSAQLHEQAGATAGRVLALQRLAEVALERGQRYRADRLLQTGMRLAESNWLAPHLLMRLQMLRVRCARSRSIAAQAIAQGDRWIAEQGMCQPCSMGFRIAAAMAAAEAGQLDQANQRIEDAERLAGMWQGGPWVAAVWEARGVQRRAEGNEEQAAGLLREAAERYRELGRMGDARRCLERVAAGQALPHTSDHRANRDGGNRAAPDN